MRFTTTKLKATDTRGERIHVKVARGDTLTGKPTEQIFAWDYASNHPHQDAAESLARSILGPGKLTLREVGWTRTGYSFVAHLV